jgi:hypothetical protein
MNPALTTLAVVAGRSADPGGWPPRDPVTIVATILVLTIAGFIGTCILLDLLHVVTR